MERQRKETMKSGKIRDKERKKKEKERKEGQKWRTKELKGKREMTKEGGKWKQGKKKRGQKNKKTDRTNERLTYQKLFTDKVSL